MPARITGNKPVARRALLRVPATLLFPRKSVAGSNAFSAPEFVEGVALAPPKQIPAARDFTGRSNRRSKPMARVKRGTKRRARRKRYLKRTKGFFLTKSKLYQSAKEAANRADRYAFRDRRNKKRQYRRPWIQRTGAAARLTGFTHGQLIHGLKAAGVALDRKVLADIAVKDAAGFAQLAEKAKAAASAAK